MDDTKNEKQEKILLKVVENLRRRGFAVFYFSSRHKLIAELLKMIPEKSVIGVGGSVTIRELGLIEILTERGNNVIHHWQKGLTEESDEVIRRKENSAPYYLTSSNAITHDGEIINIDGIGNRVAAMIYGPKNVFIIAGRNKIVDTLAKGLKRCKEYAAIMNARRVKARTPCRETGVCSDCEVTSRICRVTTIMQYRPWQTNITVMLVNESLGF